MAEKTLDSYKEFDQIRVNSWKIILFEINIYNIVSINLCFQQTEDN